MVITKSELKYPYTNDATDNKHLTGSPDSDLLNREEDYEMVTFINKYCTAHGLTTLEEALKVERLIKTHLPGNIRSHKDVTTWLENNWAKY